MGEYLKFLLWAFLPLAGPIVLLVKSHPLMLINPCFLIISPILYGLYFQLAILIAYTLLVKSIKAAGASEWMNPSLVNLGKAGIVYSIIHRIQFMVLSTIV